MDLRRGFVTAFIIKNKISAKMITFKLLKIQDYFWGFEDELHVEFHKFTKQNITKKINNSTMRLFLIFSLERSQQFRYQCVKQHYKV